MLRIIGILTILTLFASCGKSFNSQSAPVSQIDAGIIASCTTESQAMAVAQAVGGKYRVINAKRKVMEIMGVSAHELQAKLPQAKLKQNIVYQNVVEFKAQAGEVTSQSSGWFNHLAQVDADMLPNDAKGSGVKIAIVDSGVWMGHQHLSTRIYQNNNEVTNGSDSDGNGKIDDVRGWDFYNWDNDPSDDNGHGTHVAGLAAGEKSGVATQAIIIPIKVLSSAGSSDIGTITAGVLYAIDRGADVINLSLGGSTGGVITSQVQQLINALGAAASQGSIMVAAAGNGGDDSIGDCNDAEPIYPANVNNNSLISVAAVDDANRLTSYSNFGAQSVDIAAPGGAGFYGLLSTYLQICTHGCSEYSNYAGMSGTSMATPIVAGIAAVIKGLRPDLNGEQIRQIIFSSGVNIAELQGRIATGKVVNAYNASQLARSW